MTCSAVVAFTTYTGYPAALHGALGSGRHVSRLQLLQYADTGSSECSGSANQAAWTTGHCAALYEACPGWQTAPSGVGCRSRPPMDSFKAFHMSGDGQSGLPGTALHLGVCVCRAWPRCDESTGREANRRRRMRNQGGVMVWRSGRPVPACQCCIVSLAGAGQGRYSAQRVGQIYVRCGRSWVDGLFSGLPNDYAGPGYNTARRKIFLDVQEPAGIDGSIQTGSCRQSSNSDAESSGTKPQSWISFLDST